MNRIQIIFIMIITAILGLSINVYAEEVTEQESVSSKKSETESTTEEDGIYFTVTFIDDVRNTRVEKKVKEWNKVEPEKVSDERIYLDEKTYTYFEKWTKKEKNRNITFDFEQPIEKDITLYAYYPVIHERGEENTAGVIIYFDAQNGTSVKLISQSPYEKIVEPDIPQKQGYKFLGWYTEKEGGKKWNFNKILQDSYITLYAHWQYIGQDNSANISPKTGYETRNVFIMFIFSLTIVAFLGIKVVKIKNSK